MIFKQHQFGPWVAVSVLLGVLVDVSGGMMSIQLIPQIPVFGGSVTMSVTGITGRLRYFIWYKGLNASNDNTILTYIPGDNPTLSPGPLYNSRMTLLPDGSLQISNLNRTDEGHYTVRIQADQQSNIMVYLKIYAPIVYETTCPSGNGLDGGKIAVIVIGTVIGIFILEAIVYFVIKKMKSKPSGSVYENVNVSQPHNNEVTFAGSGVNPTQESNYAQLSHKNRYIYSTIEPATGK
ncbi:uncharacterized protein LOC143933643 [Lithobates pipiens]